MNTTTNPIGLRADELDLFDNVRLRQKRDIAKTDTERGREGRGERKTVLFHWESLITM